MYLRLCSPWLEALQCLCGWTVSCISLQPHLTSSHPICGHVSCLAISWNTSVAPSQLWVFSFAGPLPWNIPFRSLPGWPLLLKFMPLFKCYLLREALSVLDVFFLILHWPRTKKSFFVAPIYNCFIFLFIIFPSHVGSLEWNIVVLLLHQILVFITFPRKLCLFTTSVNTHAI